MERVVAAFYDGVEADPELRPLFPAELGPGREKQMMFLEQWLGGEPRYSERYGHPRLRRRHFPFTIDARAAGRWLHHMAAALEGAGISEQERAEILRGLGPLAQHMVNSNDDGPARAARGYAPHLGAPPPPWRRSRFSAVCRATVPTASGRTAVTAKPARRRAAVSSRVERKRPTDSGR